MEQSARTSGGSAGALMEALQVLDQLPDAGPHIDALGLETDEELVGGLSHPSADVRRGCVERLTGSLTDETVAHVAGRLDDPEWVVRYTAVHALARGATGDDRPAAPLPAVIRTATGDANTYVRMMATELLGRAAPTRPDAAYALAAVADGDADPAVRRKAGKYGPGGVLNRPTG